MTELFFAHMISQHDADAVDEALARRFDQAAQRDCATPREFEGLTCAEADAYLSQRSEFERENSSLVPSLSAR